jgi:hypothetical protein
MERITVYNFMTIILFFQKTMSYQGQTIHEVLSGADNSFNWNHDQTGSIFFYQNMNKFFFKQNHPIVLTPTNYLKNLKNDFNFKILRFITKFIELSSNVFLNFILVYNTDLTYYRELYIKSHFLCTNNYKKFWQLSLG